MAGEKMSLKNVVEATGIPQEIISSSFRIIYTGNKIEIENHFGLYYFSENYIEIKVCKTNILSISGYCMAIEYINSEVIVIYGEILKIYFKNLE